MRDTASLRPGRLRALMEQRVFYKGRYMVRFAAWQLHAQRTGWKSLSDVLHLPHEPIENDVSWSPAPPDDDDICIDDEILRHQVDQARRIGMLF
jgi:hypothetical protein